MHKWLLVFGLFCRLSPAHLLNDTQVTAFLITYTGDHSPEYAAMVAKEIKQPGTAIGKSSLDQIVLVLEEFGLSHDEIAENLRHRLGRVLRSRPQYVRSIFYLCEYFLRSVNHRLAERWIKAPGLFTYHGQIRKILSNYLPVPRYPASTPQLSEEFLPAILKITEICEQELRPPTSREIEIIIERFSLPNFSDPIPQSTNVTKNQNGKIPELYWNSLMVLPVYWPAPEGAPSLTKEMQYRQFLDPDSNPDAGLSYLNRLSWLEDRSTFLAMARLQYGSSQAQRALAEAIIRRNLEARTHISLCAKVILDVLGNLN